MYHDTIALLGDCTAGLARTAATIDTLLPGIRDLQLRQKLQRSKEDQQHLQRQACLLLEQYGGQAKHPGSIAKGMDWLRTNARMAAGGDDMTAARLVAGTCDAGVRSLSRSSNRYSMATPDATLLAMEVIRCEEGLSAKLRPYL